MAWSANSQGKFASTSAGRIYTFDPSNPWLLLRGKAIRISTGSICQQAYRNKAQSGDLVNYLRCKKTRRKRYAIG